MLKLTPEQSAIAKRFMGFQDPEDSPGLTLTLEDQLCGFIKAEAQELLRTEVGSGTAHAFFESGTAESLGYISLYIHSPVKHNDDIPKVNVTRTLPSVRKYRSEEHYNWFAKASEVAADAVKAFAEKTRKKW